MRNFFKSSIILMFVTFLLPSLAHAELYPPSQMFRIDKISIEFGQSSLVQELRSNENYMLDCFDEKVEKYCKNKQGVEVLVMDFGWKWMNAWCEINNTCDLKIDAVLSDICLIQPDWYEGTCTKDKFGGVSTSEWFILGENENWRAHCLSNEEAGIRFCVQEKVSTGNVGLYTWKKL